MRRWATFDEKPPWPGAAVSKIGSGASFLKDDRECGFDAAAHDIAVWAGLGKGARAGARPCRGLCPTRLIPAYPRLI